ncbi:MAG: hypothetical protein ICV51_05470 [Flavisolibacter sp.]|nr:hypothetical protein [Flavisolibacter sp.]MBD0295345.1 hypothetical protein [Flavisolibacter sp.]MBD0375061.1 hypothetical protein [Flavisolibacter sp.]
MLKVIALVKTAILILFIVLIPYNRKRKNNQYSVLRYLYKEALKNEDKAMALEAGRKYYSALRGGRLLPKDEQKLQKELSRMDNKITVKSADQVKMICIAALNAFSMAFPDIEIS